jgi:thioredoxin 1
VAELELTDASFDKEVLQSAQPVLVDLWAPWCGPCRMLTPVIEELAKEYAGKVKVAKLNTDDNTQTAMKYKISAIPTLLFAKGGKIVDQMVGVYPKAEIKKKIDSLL